MRAGCVTDHGITPFQNCAGFPIFSYGLEMKTKTFQMEGCGIVLKHLFLSQRDQVFNQAFRSDIIRQYHPGIQKTPHSSTPTPPQNVLASKKQHISVKIYFIKHVLTNSNLEMTLCHQFVERSVLKKTHKNRGLEKKLRNSQSLKRHLSAKLNISSDIFCFITYCSFQG